MDTGDTAEPHSGDRDPVERLIAKAAASTEGANRTRPERSVVEAVLDAADRDATLLFRARDRSEARLHRDATDREATQALRVLLEACDAVTPSGSVLGASDDDIQQATDRTRSLSDQPERDVRRPLPDS